MSTTLKRGILLTAVLLGGAFLPLQAAKKPAAKKPAGPPWHMYTDMGGFYSIKYPPSWQVLSKGNALVITSPGGPDERGVFGITPRAEGSTVEESVAKEFDDPNRSPDLKQSPARIASLPAIKVWGSKKGDPNIRIVEYYVQDGAQQYYILFQAPHVMMDKYSSVFNGMIASMRFLN